MASNETASLAEIKVFIKSLIVSTPDLYSLETLRRDFRNSIGYEIPFQRFGYRSLEDFLKSMPDILSVNRQQSGVLCVFPAGDNNKTEHITYMVSKQKKKTQPKTAGRNYQKPCNAINFSQNACSNPINNPQNPQNNPINFPQNIKTNTASANIENNYNQLFNNPFQNYLGTTNVNNVPLNVLLNYYQSYYNSIKFLQNYPPQIHVPLMNVNKNVYGNAGGFHSNPAPANFKSSNGCLMDQLMRTSNPINFDSYNSAKINKISHQKSQKQPDLKIPNGSVINQISTSELNQRINSQDNKVPGVENRSENINGKDNFQNHNQMNLKVPNGPVELGQMFNNNDNKINSKKVADVINKVVSLNKQNYDQTDLKIYNSNVKDQFGQSFSNPLNYCRDSFSQINKITSGTANKLEKENEQNNQKNCDEKDFQIINGCISQNEKTVNNPINFYQSNSSENEVLSEAVNKRISKTEPENHQNFKDFEIPNNSVMGRLDELKISLKKQKNCQMCFENQNINSITRSSDESGKNSYALKCSTDDDDVESIWDSREDESFIIQIRLNNEDFALNVEEPILPDTITSIKLHKIIITHIHNPHRFWFRFKSYHTTVYDDFKNELNEFCNKDFYKRWRLQKEHLKIGNICCMIYKNIWHRAKLLAKSKNIAKLYLIDVGIVINTYITNLRYLPKKYSIPFQAFRGSLEGIAPFTERWNNESINCFFRMSCTDVIKANIKFVKENVAYVLAFDTTKNSDLQFLNEILLNKQLAKRSENDHFENKFPTFDMIENSEYPSLFDIRDITNNLGIPYMYNELKIFREFEYLNTDDLRELYLHFKNSLTSQVSVNINKKCSLILRMKYKKSDAQEAKYKRNSFDKKQEENCDTNIEKVNLTSNEVTEKVLKWVEKYNKIYE